MALPQDTIASCIKAVGLESNPAYASRSEVKFREFDGRLIVDIKAEDLGAMRAALNTYVRWIIMCSELTKQGV